MLPHLLIVHALHADYIQAMLPRAIKGHQWYKVKFRGEFPKERKAVIPGVL